MHYYTKKKVMQSVYTISPYTKKKKHNFLQFTLVFHVKDNKTDKKLKVAYIKIWTFGNSLPRLY